VGTYKTKHAVAEVNMDVIDEQAKSNDHVGDHDGTEQKDPEKLLSGKTASGERIGSGDSETD